MIEVSQNLAGEYVHTTQTGILHGIATLLTRAHDLDQAAAALPDHAETLRTAATVLRRMATNGRAVDKALGEVADLLRAEQVQANQASATQEPEPRTINDWLAAQPSK